MTLAIAFGGCRCLKTVLPFAEIDPSDHTMVELKLSENRRASGTRGVTRSGSSDSESRARSSLSLKSLIWRRNLL
jgi:hypothetical protein